MSKVEYNGYTIHIRDGYVFIQEGKAMIQFSSVEEAKKRIDYWNK